MDLSAGNPENAFRDWSIMVRAFILSLLVLVAANLPCEAAKRIVHLFTQPYVFDFSRDYKFIKRLDQPDGKRNTVVFANQKKSIAISSSAYDPAKVGKLMSLEAFTAKMKADGSTDIKYINDETSDGRLGSHLLGGCDAKNCYYDMQSVVDQKIWLSIVVMCDDCSTADRSEVGALTEELYRQLRRF